MKQEPFELAVAGTHRDAGLALRGLRLTGGRQDGPRVLLTGALHGDEVTATGALWYLAERLRAEEDLDGTFTLLPCVNEPAVRASARLIPLEDSDLNRQFPGRADGSLAERIAATLTALLAEHDGLIDVHTAGWCDSFILLDPLPPGDLRDRTLRWAAASGFRLVGEMSGDRLQEQGLDRSWSGWASRVAGKPAFTLELPGFHKLEREAALDAADRLLGCLKAFQGLADGSAPPEPREARFEIYGNFGGLFEALVPPGKELQAGEPVGRVRALSDGSILETIAAPERGTLLAAQPISAVHPGSWLATVTVALQG
jgi:predicted deacylase